MIKQLSYLISIILLPLIVQAQIIPHTTVGVDTSKAEIQDVYNLFKNYINSKPDSLYENPFWNKNQSSILIEDSVNYNRSAWFLYNFYDNAAGFYAIYPPKILSIEKIDENRYLLRVIYNNCTEGYEKYNPKFITRLYAVKDEKGVFRLENILDYDIRNWEKVEYQFITYYVSPTSQFDKQEAKEGIKFCQKIAQKFNLKEIQPFTFYITSTPEEMGRLFNFDYWLSNSTGITSTPVREIYTAFGVASYPHEFVHMILAPLIKNRNNANALITEGVATWCAGPRLSKTYDSALRLFSNQIRDNDTLTIDDIISFKYRNQLDNSAVYLVGAVICDFVYEKKGIEGVVKILNLKLEDLKEKLPIILQKESWEEVGIEVLEYIKNYNSY